MVLSIEAKKIASKSWEVYTENGRERTGISVIDWAKKSVDMGAGEILLTSVDREGTRQGFDVDLLKAVTSEVSVPVIASGGMGTLDHCVSAVSQGGVDAVAMADILHYKRASVGEVRGHAKDAGLDVRHYEQA
jgi:cyclase